MRDKLTVTRTMSASPDAIWRVIADGDRVERWFPWVAETDLRDPSEGGLRVIRMKDGTAFDEWITLNDDEARVYQYYAPHPPLPIAHVIGTKRVLVTDAGTRLSWFVTYERKPDAPADIAATMIALYTEAMSRIDDSARGR